LANIVTLVVLLEHGAGAALAVLGLRLLLTGLFAATFFGPQFLLSVGGGVASWIGHGARGAMGKPALEPARIVAARCHGARRHAAVIVRWLFAPAGAVIALVPLFLALSIITGLVTGICAEAVLRRLDVARQPPNAWAP
jgi:uncharacterized membrane protein